LGRTLNLPQLLGTRWIVTRRCEQEFSVDVDDGEKIVQFVRNEARRLRRVLEGGGLGQV